jgi:glycerophosphoryl diester phosphodiesterase
MLPYILLAGGVVAWLYMKSRYVPEPRRRWKRFMDKAATPMQAMDCEKMQGIYLVREGSEFFGQKAVIRASYTMHNSAPVHHISIFFEKDSSFIVSEGRRFGDRFLLSGYWRKLTGSGTGVVRIETNGSKLVGKYGHGSHSPKNFFVLDRVADLPVKRPFHLIAHRGGGRNVDFLPAAENSVGMLLMAARLGATGVEIDVRWTKDLVPVLSHDDFMAFDSVRTRFFAGFIGKHTLKELRRIRLRKGGRIPTLQEALEAVLYRTPLELVWLDIKEPHDLGEIAAMQAEYMQRAKEIGRKLEIFIGIPDDKVQMRYEELPALQEFPSLCEMSPEVARKLKSAIWAPQYTKGPQQEIVKNMQAAGFRVFVWSLDQTETIGYYLDRTPFDGVVSNAMPVAAYWWWMEGK